MTCTAVTLHQPLRMQKVGIMPGVETYTVEGTPSDTVILALDRFRDSDIKLVVSGINPGANLGNDVLISGTVGGALQGYLRGLSAIAISMDSMDSPHLDDAARLLTLPRQELAETAWREIAGILEMDAPLPKWQFPTSPCFQDQPPAPFARIEFYSMDLG